MGLAATDPNDYANQLLTLTERLTGLVVAETALLKDRRPLEIGDDQETKAKLSSLYAGEVQRVKANPDRLSLAAPALKSRLAQATAAFNTALADHEAALSAMQELTEGLVRAVADHVARERSDTTAYGASNAGQRESAGAAITFDTRV